MSEEILNNVGTIMRIYVPLEYRRRFEEHLPLEPGDKVLPSSQEMGDDYQFVVYVHNYVPRREQLMYALRFTAEIYRICRKEVRLVYNMFEREEEAVPLSLPYTSYRAISS